jgi:hypothetical protein
MRISHGIESFVRMGVQPWASGNSSACARKECRFVVIALISLWGE